MVKNFTKRKKMAKNLEKFPKTKMLSKTEKVDFFAKS